MSFGSVVSTSEGDFDGEKSEEKQYPTPSSIYL